MSTKLNKDDYYNFYYYCYWGKSINKDIYIVAINRAYRDFNRTLTGFSKCLNKKSIFENAEKFLKNNIIELENSDILSQKEFDEWHKLSCDKLIDCFANNQKFSYGQAQKWINMSLKYLSMLDSDKTNRVYNFLHIPIDSIIINLVNYKFDTVWSKLNDYDKYLEFQLWFRNQYKGVPLDNEFNLWIDNIN